MSYILRRNMKTEYKLEHKKEIKVDKKQILKSLLTQEQISDLQSGNIVAICEEKKLGLEDEVEGIVLILSPLHGG